MNQNTVTIPSSPAIRPTSYADLLRDSFDHLCPISGTPLWSVTAEDVLALEIELHDELIGESLLYLGSAVEA